MKALIAILLALLCGCTSLREGAHTATALDAATTIVGVGSGVAVEVNPLIGGPVAFVAMMVGRVAAVEYVNTLAEPAKTEYLSAMNSVWWGIGVSNLIVLLAASNPVGMAAGAMFGLGWWQSTADQRLFAQMCAAERATNPKMQCEFRGVAM